jgi:hypothetical protein
MAQDSGHDERRSCWSASSVPLAVEPVTGGRSSTQQRAKRAARRASADSRRRLPDERAQPEWSEPRNWRFAWPISPVPRPSSHELRAAPTRPARARARASPGAPRDLAPDSSSPPSKSTFPRSSHEEITAKPIVFSRPAFVGTHLHARLACRTSRSRARLSAPRRSIARENADALIADACLSRYPATSSG